MPIGPSSHHTKSSLFSNLTPTSVTDLRVLAGCLAPESIGARGTWMRGNDVVKTHLIRNHQRLSAQPVMTTLQSCNREAGRAFCNYILKTMSTFTMDTSTTSSYASCRTLDDQASQRRYALSILAAGFGPGSLRSRSKRNLNLRREQCPHRHANPR